jgi:hypothetical protein
MGLKKASSRVNSAQDPQAWVVDEPPPCGQIFCISIGNERVVIRPVVKGQVHQRNDDEEIKTRKKDCLPSHPGIPGSL